MKKNENENKPIKYILLGILSILYLIVFFCINFPVHALENQVNEYTNVLEDLQRDKSFNVEDYPSISDDYSLKIIQIAETELNTIILYVYNPSYETKKYEAVYVSISQRESNGVPKLATLKLINSEGALCKYMITNEKVLTSQAYRYYDITAIYRPYDSLIDENYDTSLGLSSKYVGYEVGQLWCAYYLNDVLTYEMTTRETLDIDIKICSYIRYLENDSGFLGSTNCDAWFVGFSSDEYTIDHIYDTDLVYSSQDVFETHGIGADRNFSNIKSNISLHISDVDNVVVKGSGLFSKTFEWARIQSVDEFIKNENLDETKVNELSGTQWVFRFLETSYTRDNAELAYYERKTEITDVAILRLHFLSQGKVYNLGVVSNIVDGSDDPFIENNDKDYPDIWKWVEEIMRVVGIIILVVLLVAFAPLIANILNIIFTLLMWAFKLIITIISAPFKLFSRKKHKY